VERQGDSYVLADEVRAWYERYLPQEQIVHRAPAERIYAFSSVFLPSGLEAELFHRWEQYDSASGEWVQKGVFGFSARGGRDGGYRGYTYRDDVTEGAWRVSFETKGGRIIGRATFVVVPVPVPVERVETRF